MRPVLESKYGRQGAPPSTSPAFLATPSGFISPGTESTPINIHWTFKSTPDLTSTFRLPCPGRFSPNTNIVWGGKGSWASPSGKGSAFPLKPSLVQMGHESSKLFTVGGGWVLLPGQGWGGRGPQITQWGGDTEQVGQGM